MTITTNRRAFGAPLLQIATPKHPKQLKVMGGWLVITTDYYCKVLVPTSRMWLNISKFCLPRIRQAHRLLERYKLACQLY